jgi:hypothetical protein
LLENYFPSLIQALYPRLGLKQINASQTLKIFPLFMLFGNSKSSGYEQSGRQKIILSKPSSK